MKKHWKIALAAVAVAGLIPYSHKKDEESGAEVLQALLWSYTKKPDGDTQITIGLHVGDMPLPVACDDDVETCAEAEAVDTAAELPAEPEEVCAEAL